jgi:MSHA pilin protein MshC
MLTKMTSRNSRGFTLIEIVAVLIMLGILAVVAVARSLDTDADLISQTDVIKSHLRYAQSRAMAMEEIWGVASTGTGYYLFRQNTSNTFRLPGEESDSISLSDKGLDSMTTGNFCFNRMGRPVSIDGTEVSDDRTIRLNGNDAITIVAFTGYIH